MPIPVYRVVPAALLTAALAICLNCGKPAVTGPIPKRFENRKVRRMARQAYTVIKQNHRAEAVPLYLEAAKYAETVNDQEFTTKFLINAGACQLSIFRYHDALMTMERARQSANRTQDPDLIAISNANIAVLYLQLGNVPGAADAGERALTYLREKNPQYQRALMQLAQIRIEQHSINEAVGLLRRSINWADQKSDAESAAWAWDCLGYLYYREHRLAEAEQPLTEAFRLRRTLHLADLGGSYYHLALLRTEQGDRRSATALFDSAVEELRTPGNMLPAWNIYFGRGRTIAQSGDKKAAWETLGQAVSLARNWRAEVVANDANRTGAERELSDLYSLYIDVGNRYAAEAGVDLARWTFQAAEENRAASLRALAERETGWHSKLPLHYWVDLENLQTAERALYRTDSVENRAAVAGLRSVLDEQEAASGAPQLPSPQASVEAVQKKLDPQSVLFSFELGEKQSWLWSVTKHRIAVYALPCRGTLQQKIREFGEAVHRGSPTADQAGAELYQILFGQLPPEASRPERWLFSLDRELFALPLPALVIRFADSAPIYLGAEHALEVTPSAFIFATSDAHSSYTGGLLGIGDAIYNRADPRFHPVPASATPDDAEQPQTGQFARLWGAGDELRSVALAWKPSQSKLLFGADVSPSRIWEEVDAHPAVIHFATHVLEANDQLHTGWIATGISPDGLPRFLSPAEISARKLSASLVVLNGCSSGIGEIRAASGLMGLTRAWIAAGADHVLATRWPEPDDSGIFFHNFYRFLRQNSEKGPSYALRFACRQSLISGGWRARPQFWASYFLTGVD